LVKRLPDMWKPPGVLLGISLVVFEVVVNRSGPVGIFELDVFYGFDDRE
jgi:hypothetical protein